LGQSYQNMISNKQCQFVFPLLGGGYGRTKSQEKLVPRSPITDAALCSSPLQPRNTGVYSNGRLNSTRTAVLFPSNAETCIPPGLIICVTPLPQSDLILPLSSKLNSPPRQSNFGSYFEPTNTYTSLELCSYSPNTGGEKPDAFALNPILSKPRAIFLANIELFGLIIFVIIFKSKIGSFIGCGCPFFTFIPIESNACDISIANRSASGSHSGYNTPTLAPCNVSLSRRKLANSFIFAAFNRRGSNLACSIFVFIFSISSFTAIANPIPISIKMPTIRIFQPRDSLHLCLFKSLMFENQCFSIPLSIQSPINTNTPPMDAAAGQPQNEGDSEGDKRAKIISKWGIAYLFVLFAGIFLTSLKCVQFSKSGCVS
jgi:hypothetical protein